MKQTQIEKKHFVVWFDMDRLNAQSHWGAFEGEAGAGFERQVDALQEWLSGQKIPRCTVYLDSSQLLACEFELPEGAENLQETAVRFQAEGYLPVSVDDTVALCFRLRRDSHVFLMTVNQELVETLAQLASVVEILPRSFARVAAAAKSNAPQEQWYRLKIDGRYEYVLWANHTPRRWVFVADQFAVDAFEISQGISECHDLECGSRQRLDMNTMGPLSQKVRASLDFCQAPRGLDSGGPRSQKKLLTYCQLLFTGAMLAFFLLLLRRNNIEKTQAEISNRWDQVVEMVFPGSKRGASSLRIRSEVSRRQSHAKQIAEWESQERKILPRLDSVLQIFVGRDNVSISSIESDRDGVILQFQVATRLQLESIRRAFGNAGMQVELVSSGPKGRLIQAVLRITEAKVA